MIKQYKIYLDVCCFNRPFDDWSQSRIRLEAEAIITIINHCQSGQWMLIGSTVLDSEVAQTPNPIKRQQVIDSLRIAQTKILVGEQVIQRVSDLTKLGFKPYDALHLACAEIAQVDRFLTTDDRLLKRATVYQDILKITVDNPVTWLMTISKTEEPDDDDPS
jgi:hypothetical protein